MIFLKKINHKTIAIFIGIFFFSFLALKIIDYKQNKDEANETLSQIENYENQITLLKKRNTKSTDEKNLNADLSYYVGNIYAYSSLEGIQLEIRNGTNKYKNSTAMNLYFQEFKDKDKFKYFLQSLSYLGYVEKVTKNNVILHVSNFTVEEAKKLILLNKKD